MLTKSSLPLKAISRISGVDLSRDRSGLRSVIAGFPLCDAERPFLLLDLFIS